jgi:thiamine pyrophosphate-dependent acetolactate synthase large subunit-like protein
MRLLVMLSGMVLLSACGTAVSDRPCPRVTEFPAELQRQAADELLTHPVPALARMMDAMAADRAFNRAVCP